MSYGIWISVRATVCNYDIKDDLGIQVVWPWLFIVNTTSFYSDFCNLDTGIESSYIWFNISYEMSYTHCVWPYIVHKIVLLFPCCILAGSMLSSSHTEFISLLHSGVWVIFKNEGVLDVCSGS